MAIDYTDFYSTLTLKNNKQIINVLITKNMFTLKATLEVLKKNQPMN